MFRKCPMFCFVAVRKITRGCVEAKSTVSGYVNTSGCFEILSKKDNVVNIGINKCACGESLDTDKFCNNRTVDSTSEKTDLAAVSDEDYTGPSFPGSKPSDSGSRLSARTKNDAHAVQFNDQEFWSLLLLSFLQIYFSL